MLKKQPFLQIFSSFFPWIITCVGVALFFRVFETIGLRTNHIIDQLYLSESWGLICDLFLAGTLCTGLFIPYFLISKISSKGANITVGIVLSI
ncbi:hypothetical protein LJC53_06020, partial [Bacteroidales bacterium OttesenSCG-928-C03]|nr:hypothetical protein [Bacteroidales bacterium OttesenSCG-928-C03]